MTPPANPQTAAIVAIGTELLGPLRQDTNSLWLSARLEEQGVSVVRKSVVGDEVEAIVDEMGTAARAARYILTTGGLGPTADDVTVSAVARWLDAPLERNAAFLEKMRERFARRGVPMPECNAKQADFIAGARVLENPRGTAPGFWAVKDGREVIVLPGVPGEMREIMDALVLPELRNRAAGTVGRRRVLRIAGMGESAVEELVSPVYEKWRKYPVTILAAPGEVQLHLAVQDRPEEAVRVLEAMESDFRRVLGARIYGSDADEIAVVVGRLLREKGKTLALAESCTGGLVAALLTDVPGSSDYFLGSVVCYANSVKEGLLSVEEETIREHGAVSEATARSMAQGALERMGADLALAITGIAGPDGGSADKPVGTVFFAIEARGEEGRARKRLFFGDRSVIRRAAALHGLDLIRRHLTEERR
jgi:nicotinamide-nucleotide amidase